MRPSDIDALVSVSRPSIAPDGSFAIFATSRPDAAANRYVGQLWRVDFGGAADTDADTGAASRKEPHPHRLTRGISDTSPAVSPDGSAVAFLRPDEKNRAQIFVTRAWGGEAVQVTDQPLGVGAFSWSPDASRLAFTARVGEPGRYNTVDDVDAGAEPPRRITGVRWHANGLGYTNDRPAHVFVVSAPDLDAEPSYDPAPVATGEPATPSVVPTKAVCLTSGERAHTGVVFTRDGLEVLTVADEVNTDHADLRSRLIAVRTDGSGQRELVRSEDHLSVSEVAVAADGTIAILASDVGGSGIDFVAPGVGLWVLDGRPRLLTDPETVDLGEVGSHISPLGDDFLVQDRTRGRLRLLRVTRAGEVTEMFGGDVEVAGHAATDAGHSERVVAAVAGPDSFGEVFVIHDGVARAVTDFGSSLRGRGLAEPRELTITGRDGYPVHGWLATPGGQGPHPVILMIHGGPYASYGVHPFDEVQTLVDAGYAVAYCNPRGSAGYGRAHGRSIRQQMGTLDFHDVIDFFDGAIASDSRLDAARVGVMGGSYGGYLTAWIIAHDHRFAGAIVERGFLDPVSFQGTSDIGSFFGDEYVGTDPGAIERQSPLARAGDVRTPTLVIHSELDFRCPLEQATRYYSALKRHGVETEMLIFPGENHELTRAGQPRHRLERFDAVLDWWQRTLPVHAPASAVRAVSVTGLCRT